MENKSLVLTIFLSIEKTLVVVDLLKYLMVATNVETVYKDSSMLPVPAMAKKNIWKPHRVTRLRT